MTKTALPKILYIKREKDGSTEYFCADENAALLVEQGSKTIIGTYELIETSVGEGIAKLTPKRR